MFFYEFSCIFTSLVCRLAYNLYSMSNDQDRFTDLDVTVKTKMLYGMATLTKLHTRALVVPIV